MKCARKTWKYRKLHCLLSAIELNLHLWFLNRRNRSTFGIFVLWWRRQKKNHQPYICLLKSVSPFNIVFLGQIFSSVCARSTQNHTNRSLSFCPLIDSHSKQRYFCVCNDMPMYDMPSRSFVKNAAGRPVKKSKTDSHKNSLVTYVKPYLRFDYACASTVYRPRNPWIWWHTQTHTQHARI